LFFAATSLYELVWGLGLWYLAPLTTIFQLVAVSFCAYHHLSCEFEPRLWRGVLNTTLYDKVCQWLATGRWFSLCTPVSPTNKTFFCFVYIGGIVDHHCLNFLLFCWYWWNCWPSPFKFSLFCWYWWNCRPSPTIPPISTKQKKV
jgi:hypothetical protein